MRNTNNLLLFQLKNKQKNNRKQTILVTYLKQIKVKQKAAIFI